MRISGRAGSPVTRTVPVRQSACSPAALPKRNAAAATATAATAATAPLVISCELIPVPPILTFCCRQYRPTRRAPVQNCEVSAPAGPLTRSEALDDVVHAGGERLDVVGFDRREHRHAQLVAAE